MIAKKQGIDDCIFTVLFYGRIVKMTGTVKTWEKTKLQNLVRHKSGRYYARLFLNGKEIWKLACSPKLDPGAMRDRRRESAAELST